MVPIDLWWCPPLVASAGIFLSCARDLSALRPLHWPACAQFVCVSVGCAGALWLAAWLAWGS